MDLKRKPLQNERFVFWSQTSEISLKGLLEIEKKILFLCKQEVLRGLRCKLPLLQILHTHLDNLPLTKTPKDSQGVSLNWSPKGLSSMYVHVSQEVLEKIFTRVFLHFVPLSQEPNTPQAKSARLTRLFRENWREKRGKRRKEKRSLLSLSCHIWDKTEENWN